MNKSILIIVLITCHFITHGVAQTGGKRLFEFGTASGDPSILATGGIKGAFPADRVIQGINSPSHLTDSLSFMAGISWQFRKSGIQQGTFATNWFSKSMNLNFSPIIQWISWGTFQSSDELGNIEGSFKALDLKTGLNITKKINQRLSVGAGLYYLSSNIETYRASGISGSLSGLYYNPIKEEGFGIDLVNVGFLTGQYSKNSDQKLTPFDLRVAYSRKLKHMPLRFSIIGHHLYQWDIQYVNTNAQSQNIILGEATTQTNTAFQKFTNNLFRHINFSGELLFGSSRSFSLRFGYNHMLRTDLHISGQKSLTGISMGFGLRKKFFSFDYSLQFYHTGNNFHTVGLQMPLTGYKKAMIE